MSIRTRPLLITLKIMQERSNSTIGVQPEEVRAKIVINLPLYCSIKKILNFIDVLIVAQCTASLVTMTTEAPISRCEKGF